MDRPPVRAPGRRCRRSRRTAGWSPTCSTRSSSHWAASRPSRARSARPARGPARWRPPARSAPRSGSTSVQARSFQTLSGPLALDVEAEARLAWALLESRRTSRGRRRGSRQSRRARPRRSGRSRRSRCRDRPWPRRAACAASPRAGRPPRPGSARPARARPCGSMVPSRRSHPVGALGVDHRGGVALEQLAANDQHDLLLRRAGRRLAVVVVAELGALRPEMQRRDVAQPLAPRLRASRPGWQLGATGSQNWRK